MYRVGIVSHTKDLWFNSHRRTQALEQHFLSPDAYVHPPVRQLLLVVTQAREAVGQGRRGYLEILIGTPVPDYRKPGHGESHETGKGPSLQHWAAHTIKATLFYCN